MPDTVPIVDLSGCATDVDRRREVAATIDLTFRATGFMVIVGHGVDCELTSRMYTVTAEFFLQSDAEKLRYLSPVGTSTRRGFSRSNYSAASRDEATPRTCASSSP